MVKGIAHVCIESEDLERTRWFYCDVLGMEKQFDFIKEGKPFGFYLKMAGGSFIEVFSTASLPRGKSPIKHFCLETDDIDGVISALEANGIAHRGKKKGSDSSWQVWTSDPSGIDFEFHQYTPESSQFTGKECVVTW